MSLLQEASLSTRWPPDWALPAVAFMQACLAGPPCAKTARAWLGSDFIASNSQRRKDDNAPAPCRYFNSTAIMAWNLINEIR